MLPLISFKTGRKTQTQSSGRGRNGCASKWKSGSSNQKEPRPRGQHTRRKNLKEFTPALLRSASGEFCSLDKDLSWKSGYRRCGFWLVPLSDCRVSQESVHPKRLAETCYEGIFMRRTRVYWPPARAYVPCRVVKRLRECLTCTTMRTGIMPRIHIDTCVLRPMARISAKPVGSQPRRHWKFRNCSTWVPIPACWRLVAVPEDMLCTLRRNSVARSWEWILTNRGSVARKNSHKREPLVHEHVSNNATFRKISLSTTRRLTRPFRTTFCAMFLGDSIYWSRCSAY